ncbi:MAG: hypothetical protein J6S85_07960 [Methanobrevibacter sp.]|nr:hypothetical protein [Methanobrevibacter sp.]
MQDKSLEELQKEFNDYKASKENEIKELELKNKQLESEKHDLEVSNQTLNNLKLHQEVKTFKKSILEDIE